MMSFFKLKFNRNAKMESGGLTMVETLVAISILTIAVIGPLGIIAQALHTSYYTRDQMTAYYLAQEAIEHVRNLRDTQGLLITKDGLVDASWLSDVVGTSTGANPYMTNTSGSGGTKTYSMERNSSSGDYNFEECPITGTCPYLLTSNGIYGVETGTSGAMDSVFRREIYFQASGLDNPQQFMMVVNVYWKSGSSLAKLTLKEFFTNWTTKVETAP